MVRKNISKKQTRKTRKKGGDKKTQEECFLTQSKQEFLANECNKFDEWGNAHRFYRNTKKGQEIEEGCEFMVYPPENMTEDEFNELVKKDNCKEYMEEVKNIKGNGINHLAFETYNDLKIYRDKRIKQIEDNKAQQEKVYKERLERQAAEKEAAEKEAEERERAKEAAAEKKKGMFRTLFNKGGKRKQKSKRKSLKKNRKQTKKRKGRR